MKPDISILLPTRGRTDMLDRSLMSLIDLAAHPEQIEVLLLFDDDDTDSMTWFQENIAPKIDALGAKYTCWQTERMGYGKLHQYVNYLASQAQAPWLMFWNDDAVMQTQGWDQHISCETDFNVLRMLTHNQHPYAIFPIVPASWYKLFGYLSQHQLSDAWISQIAYMLDVVKNIPVEVLHDRHDLTGQNQDTTFNQRVVFEGRPQDPRDFNHMSARQHRLKDAVRLANFLEGQGYDMTWFRNVANGTQDPWERMTGPEFDPNKQLKVYPKS
jgi:hypothetical protein